MMSWRIVGIIGVVGVAIGCGARTGIGGAADGGPDATPDAEPIPPVVTCEPDEAWTTIDRRSVIYGDGEDDGRIVSWQWAVVERPEGSVVDPVPRHAQTTSLTPDAEGDYVVELTAVDDEGESATCRSTIHSIVGPPVAFCPDDIMGASVGRTYTLEGDGFDDVAIAGFTWEIVERPEGSRAQPEPPDEPVTSLTPDLAGSYVLRLTVTDNEGLQGTCEVTVSSSGPPRAICPEEATVPTRQPHVLHGDAEDDGEISLWSWELLEQPEGSTARLASSTSQDARLTPDRVGDYVVRLTVTDDTGLTDSCETVVHATPTPPDVVCPDPVTTTPLTEVVLRADWEDDGVVVGWEWELVSAPEGSAAAPPSPPDEQVTSFMPDVAGTYTIRLTVIDDDGMEGDCETTVDAIPGEGLRVELYWNPPDRSCDTHPSDPDCDPTDVDLHLLHPDAPSWFTESGRATDCFYANCQDGESWDTSGPEDDPRLDLDDVDGYGPENINIDAPVVGHVYTVGVHYYDDDGVVEPVQAYVTIYCSTLDSDPVYTVGPIALTAGPDFEAHDFWRVATVRWDGVRCEVTPLTGPDGGPDIITYREARDTR